MTIYQEECLQIKLHILLQQLLELIGYLQTLFFTNLDVHPGLYTGVGEDGTLHLHKAPDHPDGHLGAGIMQDSAHSTQATGMQVHQGGPYPVGEVDWGLTPNVLRIQDPHFVCLVTKTSMISSG